MNKKYYLQFNRFEYKSIVWLFILLKNVYSTIEHEHFYLDNHHTEKQMSLESCLGRFDVHGNTIIRTGESQAIGGKFLQGLELETPEKCQRLCCETSDCDVYVFEEKNNGYCYLFQCGSPKNFHCKFTRHSNYTSALLTQFKAVLTTTPRPNTHISITNISAQEQELISLKAKPEKFLISSTTQTIIQEGNENGLKVAKPAERRKPSCGRFEFLCHSGECIAVYNACNGIPQCVDGSDEGPECAVHENAKSDIVLNSPTYNYSFKKLQKIPIVETSILETSHPIDLKETKNGHFEVSNDLETDSFMSSNYDKVKNVLDLEQSNGKQVKEQREMYLQIPEIKNSFPTPQISPEKAHIFNENSEWQTEQGQQHNIVTHEPPYSSLNQPSNNNHGNSRKYVATENKETPSVDSKLFNQNSQATPRIQSNAEFPEKNSEYADYSEKIVENVNKDMTLKKNKITKISRPASSAKKAAHPAFMEQYIVMEQHLEIKFTDHDGHSEKPRGAVLSLTLGLMVTGVIVILIGCRLRTFGRRRSRHGGKVPYAPDEDFLVNGMYL